MTALAVAAVIGLGYTAYPVRAQKETTIATPEKSTVPRAGTATSQADSVAEVVMDGKAAYYSTLNEAVQTVSDANGTATITLLDDASLTGWFARGINGNIIFKGENHTVTGDGLGIDIEGSLTVLSGNFAATASLYSSGVIEIEGGTFEYLAALEASVVNIYGGSVKLLDVFRNGTANLYSGSVTRISKLSGANLNYRPVFEVNIFQVTNNVITIEALEYQETFGRAEYSLDGQSWQSSNYFINLQPNTTYTVYARYEKAPDIVESTTATTAKPDGSAVIAEPGNLTGKYEQKLSDVNLPAGWTWADGTTALVTGSYTYPARFDTKPYESQYDFTAVSGYSQDGHYVERNLTVTTSKADSSIAFRDGFSLNKTYDTKPVSINAGADVVVRGSTGSVSFTYEKLVDNTWRAARDISAPVNAGRYRVTASVEDDENYNGSQVDMIFEIRKATPSYTLPKGLIIKQGEALSSLKLPAGFTWKDENQVAGVLGEQTFRAVFTPEDTDNYQIVEADITVEVVSVLPPLNHAPVITAEDKILTVGDSFDPKKGVTASDTEDGDLTGKIEVISNNVDTAKAGTYEVTYKVTDNQGASATKTITVTVSEKAGPQTQDKNNNGADNKTDEPVKNDGAQTAVKTGDDTNILVWSVLSAVSAMGLMFTVLFRRRKHN